MMMYERLLKIAASGLLVLGIGLCGVPANAQAGPSGEHMGRGHRMSPDEELQRLDKALKLTDDQKNQIKPILEDRQQKMQSLRSDTSLSEQDRRSKMRSTFQDSNSKIRDLLNDDQKKKFDEMQPHGRGRMQGHRPGGGAASGTPQQ
jgi:Spy/CpxP family protein refolding chaperone